MSFSENIIGEDNDLNCADHPDQQGSWFCNTCSKLICHECMTHTHNSHSYVYTEIKVKNILEEAKLPPIHGSVIVESKDNIAEELLILKKFVECEISNIQSMFEDALKDTLNPFFNFLKVIE